jgi:hypothetical protein
MEPSVLHSQVNEFEERNTFLYFVLGLVSISRSFVHHLESEQQRLNEQPDLQSESRPDETSVTHLRDLLL